MVSDVVAHYRAWSEAAPYPDLVRKLYLVQSTPGSQPKVFQVNVQDETLQAAEWPENMATLDDYFRRSPKRPPCTSQPPETTATTA